MIQIAKWIKNNIMTTILVVIITLLIGYIAYDKLSRDTGETTPIVIDPNTTRKTLPNGEKVDIKVATPPVKSLEEAGFSKDYIDNTLKKKLKLKEKDIKSVTKLEGTFKDELTLSKTEVTPDNKVTKIYESKDSTGKVIGTNIVTDSTSIYHADIDLSIITKKGKKADSLIFYDPTQRATIGGSREFIKVVPKESKWKITTTIGFGFVAPLNTKQVSPGFFGGVGISRTF